MNTVDFMREYLPEGCEDTLAEMEQYLPTIEYWHDQGQYEFEHSTEQVKEFWEAQVWVNTHAKRILDVVETFVDTYNYKNDATDSRLSLHFQDGGYTLACFCCPPFNEFNVCKALNAVSWFRYHYKEIYAERQKFFMDKMLGNVIHNWAKEVQ